MARKRTGTLIWRKKGWSARVPVKKVVDGETITEKQYFDLGTTSKAAATRKLGRLLAQLVEGPLVTAAAVEETVAEYAAPWIEDRRAAGVVMVKEEEANFKRHVLPEIGPKPLSQVRPADILGVLRNAIAKGLSRGSLAHIRAAMRRLFESAAVEELIPSNPVDRVKLKQLGMKRELKKERCILTDDEFAALMASEVVDLEIKLLGLASRIEGGCERATFTAGIGR
jgi:hypothetical protein